MPHGPQGQSMNTNLPRKAQRPQDGQPARSKRGRRLPPRIAIVVAVMFALSAVLILLPPGQPLRSLMPFGSSSGPRAAILDQLDLTYPNTEFVQAATTMFERAGYEVDYYRGAEVTVGV